MTLTKLVVAFLSVVSILLLALSFALDSDSELYRLIGFYDFCLCLFFFYDFVGELRRAPNRWRYFYTVGWIDLLSAVPVIQEFRFARFVRLVRIVRVLKSLRILIAFLQRERQNSIYTLIMLLVITAVVTCSACILYVEQGVGNIQTAEDTLWWTFITVTTVGYGDYYPVTNLGKGFAAVLILTGLIGFGSLISFLSNTIESYKASHPAPSHPAPSHPSQDPAPNVKESGD